MPVLNLKIYAMHRSTKEHVNVAYVRAQSVLFSHNAEAEPNQSLCIRTAIFYPFKRVVAEEQETIITIYALSYWLLCLAINL